MTTAVDTSVLLDVLSRSPHHLRGSRAALGEARRRGRIIACPVVWAEVAAFFEEPGVLETALGEAGIEFDPFDRLTAELAGAMWRDYRSRGGRRERLLTDFLVAAHARARADRLLTRDRGLGGIAFRELEVVDPGRWDS